MLVSDIEVGISKSKTVGITRRQSKFSRVTPFYYGYFSEIPPLFCLSTLSHCSESFKDSHPVCKLQWPGSQSEVTCVRT